MQKKRLECVKFGLACKKIRESKGLSQEKVAELARYHRTYYSGIERGERNLSLIAIHRVAKALGVPPAKLVE